MEVKKVGCFSVNEIETLRLAGTILGNTVKAFEAGDIDDLDERDTNLLAALQDVLSRVAFYAKVDPKKVENSND